MNTSLLERIVVILTEKGGFQRQPRLVLVDDVDFEFDAILCGPRGSEGLVVLMEPDKSQVPMAISHIRAMSQLMLRSGSMRPLTLVLLLQIQDPVVLRELASVCRVIQVSGSEHSHLIHQLRSLLPLVLPEPEGPQADATRLLRGALGSVSSDSFVSSLLAAGRRGESAVEEEVTKAIVAVISEALMEKSE